MVIPEGLIATYGTTLYIDDPPRAPCVTMPPSQLKRLKQSLREQGVVGPQQSKKSHRKTKNDGAARQSQDSRAARLQVVRDQFNPFEFKTSDAPKFAIVGGNARHNPSVHRPGATKSSGEEKVILSWILSF